MSEGGHNNDLTRTSVCNFSNILKQENIELSWLSSAQHAHNFLLYYPRVLTHFMFQLRLRNNKNRNYLQTRYNQIEIRVLVN